MNVFPLLATGAPERAVWLSFGFYLLNVLVPIIPAVIIYRLFPEGTTRAPAARVEPKSDPNKPGEPGQPPPPIEQSGTSVEGTFGGWKIKAVGAWGAYVTAFLLGFWAINTTAIPLIKAVGGASVWTIESDFKFTDENGKEISDTVDKLQVEPPKVKPWGKRATITVFSETLEPPDQIQLKLEGYDYQTVDLTNCVKNGKIKPPTITLKRLPPIAAGPPPAALAPGEGPAALTAKK
jgi:hypothetical protein